MSASLLGPQPNTRFISGSSQDGRKLGLSTKATLKDI